ncbi:MAG: PDR/VanB family oxidoreductase [Pseudomonadales bacterium]
MNSSALTVRIENIEQLTADVRSYRLTPLDGGELPTFNAGAHIDLLLGEELIRQYSLCGDPQQRGSYQIAVLKDPHSRGGSDYIHAELNAGDTLTINAPRNHFALDESAAHYQLIAGGIGITPIMLMAARLQALGKSFTLHYLCRSAEQAPFASQLKEQFGDALNFHFTGGDAAKRLNIEALFAAQPAGTQVYTCGSEGLLQAILNAGEQQPHVKIHFERFSAAPVDSSDDKAFEIELSSSGERLSVAPEQSILEVLQAAGHSIDTMCKEGLCGSCEVEMLGGEADHRDSVLSDDEKAEQSVLMVCCSRAKSDVIVLDL